MYIIMELLLKVNPGIYWLAGAILTDVFSTFYSAKANGLEDVKSQIVAGILYGLSFVFCAIALKYMQAYILYVLWSGIGTVATALLAQQFLNQHIDTAGWVGMGFIVLGLTIISQWSTIDA